MSFNSQRYVYFQWRYEDVGYQDQHFFTYIDITTLSIYSIYVLYIYIFIIYIIYIYRLYWCFSILYRHIYIYIFNFLWSTTTKHTTSTHLTGWSRRALENIESQLWHGSAGWDPWGVVVSNEPRKKPFWLSTTLPETNIAHENPHVSL